MSIIGHFKTLFWRTKMFSEWLISKIVFRSKTVFRIDHSVSIFVCEKKTLSGRSQHRSSFPFLLLLTIIYGNCDKRSDRIYGGKLQLRTIDVEIKVEGYMKVYYIRVNQTVKDNLKKWKRYGGTDTTYGAARRSFPLWNGPSTSLDWAYWASPLFVYNISLLRNYFFILNCWHFIHFYLC